MRRVSNFEASKRAETMLQIHAAEDLVMLETFAVQGGAGTVQALTPARKRLADRHFIEARPPVGALARWYITAAGQAELVRLRAKVSA